MHLLLRRMAGGQVPADLVSFGRGQAHPEGSADLGMRMRPSRSAVRPVPW
jgi:hypothetical protein